MNADTLQPNANLNEQVRAVLQTGATAALVTVLESPDLSIGAKLLVRQGGERFGDLGVAELNDAAAAQAIKFLSTRDEARTAKVAEFAPELRHLSESLVLFERIEGEPRLVIAGAGHVGASLARLATLVGYRVTLIDDRGEFVARELFSSPVEQNIELVAATNWLAFSARLSCLKLRPIWNRRATSSLNLKSRLPAVSGVGFQLPQRLQRCFSSPSLWLAVCISNGATRS